MGILQQQVLIALQGHLSDRWGVHASSVAYCSMSTDLVCRRLQQKGPTVSCITQVNGFEPISKGIVLLVVPLIS